MTSGGLPSGAPVHLPAPRCTLTVRRVIRGIGHIMASISGYSSHILA